MVEAENIQEPRILFNGYYIERLTSEHEIKAMVERVADEIYRDYHNKQLLLIGILKGANIFLGDLARELGRGNPEIGRLPMPVEIDFLQVSSYDGEVSSGAITKGLAISTDINNRDVLLVEDILDTGRTMQWIKEELAKQHPVSLKICVLLDKYERREVDIKPDYVGYKIPDKFVIGYGLDFNQQFRNLPYIGVVAGKAVD